MYMSIEKWTHFRASFVEFRVDHELFSCFTVAALCVLFHSMWFLSKSVSQPINEYSIKSEFDVHCCKLAVHNEYYPATKKTLARKVLTVYIVFLISAAYILLLLITQGADANCAICTHTKNARQNARQNAHANCAESLPQIWKCSTSAVAGCLDEWTCQMRYLHSASQPPLRKWEMDYVDNKLVAVQSKRGYGKL